MSETSLEFLTEQIELADQLAAGRDQMHEPQDLPGRFGRAIRAIDHILGVMGCESVLGGGWAVWHHGYAARVTQDIDIALPADRIDEFIRVACVSGFEVIPQPEGRWPKVRHKESGVKVDILPEGARPGTAARPAPTLIPHPSRMGAAAGRLRYMEFASLMELKLAAGRGRDDFDVIELMRIRMEQAAEIRKHLAAVHADYVAAFDRLVERAKDQRDE
ncbi:MAG: hypothetical protein HY000_39845 [Planctomycetes bacterium]|nr:hypothetical protein [Planctomycetota bacterium]